MQDRQQGFSLVELLVVVVIIGILAAIGIPRLLAQRERARDTTALADLRALITVETGLEATTGLSDDPAAIAAAGWAASDDRVVVCADLLPGSDIELTAWHRDGSSIYSWSRTSPRIAAAVLPLPDDCSALGAAVS